MKLWIIYEIMILEFIVFILTFEKVIYLFLRKYGNYFVFVRVYDLKKF